MATALLNVDGVLIHKGVDALEKFKGVTWLFHGVDRNRVLVLQSWHELRVKVLLFCQNKHIVDVQQNQTLFVAQKTWIGITMLEVELLMQETTDTLKPSWLPSRWPGKTLPSAKVSFPELTSVG